jgi:hypothetical protein
MAATAETVEDFLHVNWIKGYLDEDNSHPDQAAKALDMDTGVQKRSYLQSTPRLTHSTPASRLVCQSATPAKKSSIGVLSPRL